MKTKALVWRYPRKISLLKDLGRGYPRPFLLRKSMKTGGELRYPSKISLLKDLAADISDGDRSAAGWKGACARISKLSKSRKSHCRYQTANAVIIMLAALGSPRQGKTAECARSSAIWVPSGHVANLAQGGFSSNH